jgi:hypothetical protein
MRASIFWFVEEVANADRAFQGEGGVQCCPGEGEGAGTTRFYVFAASSVAGTGKFTLKRAGVYPVFWMGDECEMVCCLQEIPSYVFII